MLLVQKMPLDGRTDAQQALNYAIKLEHATIPPYLTALWSLRQGTNTAIQGRIRNIVVQEMKHMASAANILNALDGAPEIDQTDFIPTYPGGCRSTSAITMATSSQYIF